jgi:hypothetical protein
MDHGVNGVAANAHNLRYLGGGKICFHNLLDKFWRGKIARYEMKVGVGLSLLCERSS